jgi:hypothetical protein
MALIVLGPEGLSQYRLLWPGLLAVMCCRHAVCYRCGVRIILTRGILECPSGVASVKQDSTWERQEYPEHSE